jgi:hypothetical protein
MSARLVHGQALASPHSGYVQPDEGFPALSPSTAEAPGTPPVVGEGYGASSYYEE